MIVQSGAFFADICVYEGASLDAVKKMVLIEYLFYDVR